MMIFQAARAAGKKGEKFDAIGEQDVRFGTIHQDDLADLFLRVAERVSTSYIAELIPGTHMQRPRVCRTQSPVGTPYRYLGCCCSSIRCKGLQPNTPFRRYVLV
jgi:hypothetical protein